MYIPLFEQSRLKGETTRYTVTQEQLFANSSDVTGNLAMTYLCTFSVELLSISPTSPDAGCAGTQAEQSVTFLVQPSAMIANRLSLVTGPMGIMVAVVIPTMAASYFLTKVSRVVFYSIPKLVFQSLRAALEGNSHEFTQKMARYQV